MRAGDGGGGYGNKTNKRKTSRSKMSVGHAGAVCFQIFEVIQKGGHVITLFVRSVVVNQVEG